MMEDLYNKNVLIVDGLRFVPIKHKKLTLDELDNKYRLLFEDYIKRKKRAYLKRKLKTIINKT